MEARYDWLFWLERSEISRVLYISSKNKEASKRFNELSIDFHSITTMQECLSICEAGRSYDLVFIESITTKDKEIFSRLGELVRNEGYFILGIVHRNIISRLLKKTILKHSVVHDSENCLGADAQKCMDMDLYKSYDKLYVYPSVKSPWTLSNTVIILKQMQWWKRSKNKKVLMIQKLLSISIFAQLCIYFWPDTINIYRKIR